MNSNVDAPHLSLPLFQLKLGKKTNGRKKKKKTVEGQVKYLPRRLNTNFK